MTPSSLALALLPILAAPMGGGAELAPEVLLLARIKQAAREGLSQIPAYACLETVERFSRRSKSAKYNKLDAFQVQVAQIGARELFARPGDREFQDKPLMDLVRPGMIATGLFYSMAHTVFMAAATVFAYNGPERHAGHKAVRYDYRIPQLFSNYQISSNGHAAQVGLEGSIWADLETHELLELEARAVDIPPLLHMRNTVTLIRYHATRMGERNYFIPSTALITTVSDNGIEDQNKTEFRDCHRYTGESKITF